MRRSALGKRHLHKQPGKKVCALLSARTGGFLKKRMTTIYVDSRKRVAGSDSDFKVDLGESLHLHSDARLGRTKSGLLKQSCDRSD